MPLSPNVRSSKNAILALSALAALIAVPAVRAQITYDAQIPFSFSSPTLSHPRGVAVTSTGTVYIADTSVGIVQITPTTGYVGGAAKGAALIASTATRLTNTTLTAPTTVAVDANGNLYAADAGKVIELPYPVTTSTAVTITYSAGETPTALAVDSSNNLYIADETKNAIYEVTAGVATKLAISPATLKPVGLAVNSAGIVYFASALNNEVYTYTPATTTTAVDSTAGTFEFSSRNAVLPIGMGFDPGGNLYVLDSAAGNLTEVTSTTDYQLPLTTSVTADGLAVSSIGNLYLSDAAGETADEVFYNNNPFNFGPIQAGTNSPAVTVNFLFGTRARSPAVYQSMQGAITTEFQTSSTTCGGTKGTACSMAFYVDYSSTLPGTRNGVVGLTDNAGDLLTVPSTGIDLASALALYPGTQSALSQTSQALYEPQGLAVTGNGGTLFVADEGEVRSGESLNYTGAVWQYAVTSGVPGGTPTKLGKSQFSTPDALALDAQGNLYVADYGGAGLGSVWVIPVSHSSAGNTWTGYATTLNLTGAVALNHPMALAFDPSGNLYIGDMGPAGTDATASNPGYIIKVPADGGPAVRLNYTVGGVPIVFPDALATDSYGNLYIADGGDGDTDPGGVDVVPVSTGTPAAISFSSISPALNQPSGLGFDAANDLYVLDGFNYRILVVPMTYSGTVPTADTADISLLGQGNSGLSTLVTPSNMVVWPGGQYLSVSDIGYQPQSGTGSPTQVLTLQSVNESVDASSGPPPINGVDVGNEEIHFERPSNTNSAAFSLTGCGSNGTTLETGVAPVCTPTITFIGTGTQSATITLNGDPATDYSALGNKIYVTAEPNEPVATIASPTFSFSATNTATLTNSGNQSLSISNIQVTGNATNNNTGTCSTVTSLAANSSCTVIFTIKNDFSTGTVTVTDNSGYVSGSEQSTSTFYLFSFGLVRTGGTNLGEGLSTLNLPTTDVPRNLLNQDTSNSSNTLSQPTNTKGGKKAHQ